MQKQKNSVRKKALVAASLGTLIEYYDCVLFIIFLPIIAPLYFPADTLLDSFSQVYLVLLLSMVMRPLGGLMFGHIGDVIGRPKALLASMYGIAITTSIIGILPDYATIGIASTLILVIAKAIQMFCFGGEYNGAGIYVVEHAPEKKEGITSSLIGTVTCLGALLASLVGIIITHPSMPLWSWRVAFISGGILGILAAYYRKQFIESPQFRAADRQKQNFTALIKHYPKQLIAGFFVGGLSTAPISSILLFVNPILLSKGLINNQEFMYIQTLLSLIAIPLVLFAGKIADKRSSYYVMLIACLIMIPASCLCFTLLNTYNLPIIITSFCVLIVISNFFFAPAHAYLKQLFPPQYRYRGSSFSYGLGLSFVAGLTPIIQSYLYRKTGSFVAPGLWVTFISLGAFYSLRLCHNRPHTLDTREVYGLG